ncbi:mediator of RNA polymerase II transcription subunit 12 [Aplysia californica]|uniref:Mediator of RNA polymerase II transcription subunit 12 n=1 Tax=Aplysia californica TaxID=6500 RepID=A0ABM1AAV8_APLCA|nr:mediator of RNA polymerase II transcription subunit 12 [Aplysia californica]
MQAISLKLNEMQRNRELLEKQTFNLTEELRGVRSKVESQAMELTTTINDLKLRSRRLEEENKIQLDALRKQGDLFSSTETSTTHLRGQVETRLAELRDVVLELRNKQDQEANDRRALEQQLQQKVNQLQQNLGEQNRKREEAMHAMDMIHREKEHSAENEKLRLQGKLTETVEEVNKRLLTKEIKLREELQEKFNHLEKMVQQEQQVRQKHEATIREENEKWRQGLKKVSDEEMYTVRDTFQSERQKSKEAVQKLDESIGLIEKQLAENKRQSDKVVAAEIKSRKQHEKATSEKLDHLNEKLSLATASLQTAMGGITGNLTNHTDKLRGEMKSMLASSEQAGTRTMTDMDARMQSLKQKVNNLEQQLDGRISETMGLMTYPEALEFSEATAILAQNLREKVESISLWQDVTSQTIRELNQSIQGLPNDIYALEEKQKLLKSEVDSRLTTETDARIRDVEALKHEVSMLRNKRQPQFATAEEMQELQISVRKLAESVQSVKTVIGMKLQSEQKLRLSGIEDLQIQVNRLKSQVGMHSGMHSTMPLYARPDTDPNFMDDFMAHDITQDIPYGRSSFRLPDTRADLDSAEPVHDGYAAKYSKKSAGPAGGDGSVGGYGKGTGRPLDTVSEGGDSQAGQADWNLLSSLAYGSYDEKGQGQKGGGGGVGDKDNDDEGGWGGGGGGVGAVGDKKEGDFPNPRKKDDDGDGGGDYAKEGERGGESRLRRTPPNPRDGGLSPAVERTPSGARTFSPHDRATEASFKGARPPQPDSEMSAELDSVRENERRPESMTEAPSQVSGKNTPMNNSGVPNSRKNSLAKNAADQTSRNNSPTKSVQRMSRKNSLAENGDHASQRNTPAADKTGQNSRKNSPVKSVSRMSRKNSQAENDGGQNMSRRTSPTEKTDENKGGEKSPMKNTLDWEPASPGPNARDTAGAKDSARDQDKPMSNRLAWEPATPTPRNDGVADPSEVKGHWGQESVDETDSEDHTSGNNNSHNNNNDMASAEQVLAAV